MPPPLRLFADAHVIANPVPGTLNQPGSSRYQGQVTTNVEEASQLLWEFPDFADLTAFTLNGSAAGIANPVSFNGSSVLRLADNYNQAGSGFLSEAVPVRVGGAPLSFSSRFELQITDSRNTGADGITFTVTDAPTRLGGFGVGIGYSGISPSIAVELDTWNNGGIDGGSGNHVGFNRNGSVDSGPRHELAIDLENELIKWAWVDYDAASGSLEVRLAETPVRPQDPVLATTVDLAAALGLAGDDGSAYFGFTSGTGSAAADHDLRAWTLAVGPAPLPPLR